MNSNLVFCTKVHIKNGKTILAICDLEILGKKIYQNGLKIEINKEFYDGGRKNLKEIIDLMGQSDIINIFGTKIITELDKKGVLNKKFSKNIGGVLHVQIVKP